METLQRLHNRGSVSTVYDIDNSLKLEANNSENLYRNLHASTSTTKFTHSAWYKRTELGSSMLLYMRGVAGNESVFLRTNGTADTLQVDIGAGGTNSRSFTTQYVRDTSAWYHLVLAVDTTQSTATDRFKLYINGNLITDYSSRNNPSQNFAMETSSAQHRYGSYNNTDGYAPFSGYIAECNYIDGLYLDPTSFGEFDEDSGIWKPKQYTGSYGTGGYYLDFSDSSDLGANAKGDDVNFTLRNIAAADQATDTPTNNFATFNPLDTFTGNFVISNGATKIQQSSGNSGYKTHCATIGVTVGKWYAEFKAGTGWGQGSVGVNQLESSKDWEEGYIGQYSNSTAIGMGYMNDGQFARNGGTGAIGSSYTAGDIIGIALLINANGTGFMGMSKNGTWQNSQDPSSGTTGMLGLYYGNALPDGMFHTFAVTTRHDNGPWLANFGGFNGFTVSSGNSDANGYGNFEYAVPTGYYALCTKNLAEFGG